MAIAHFHYPKLAMGPILYYWSQDTIFKFYDQLAQTPIDIIYLGETVCSKRKLLRTTDWLALANELKSSGKIVVLSTMALLEADSELQTLKRLCENNDFMVEVNDIAALQFLAGKPFVAGLGINIYNNRTLTYLSQLGLQRWILPVELSHNTLEMLHQARPAGVETEVFVYGRLPLAYSARCFTARAHNLPKDDCQYRCLDYPDGLLLSSQEKQPFLVLNGIQTQSAHYCNLLTALPTLTTMKIDVLRISPYSQHSEQVIDIFYQSLRQPNHIENYEQKLQRLTPLGNCNGYWYGKEGMINYTTQI